GLQVRGGAPLSFAVVAFSPETGKRNRAPGIPGPLVPRRAGEFLGRPSQKPVVFVIARGPPSPAIRDGASRDDAAIRPEVSEAAAERARNRAAGAEDIPPGLLRTHLGPRRGAGTTASHAG